MSIPTARSIGRSVMRGRLICPFWAEIARVSGESEMDPDFKEPRALPRHELPSIRVPCQVEPKIAEELNMGAAGDSPKTEIGLVFHFRDLDRLGLVDEKTGTALIRPNDRLAAIWDAEGRCVESFPHPPGTFVVQAQPRGFGLGRRCNLLLVHCVARSLSPGRVE